jgi:hypothetical protein
MYTQDRRNAKFIQRYSKGLIAAFMGILAGVVSVVLTLASTATFQQLAQNWKPVVGIILGFAILLFTTTTIASRWQRLSPEEEKFKQEVIKAVDDVLDSSPLNPANTTRGERRNHATSK